MEPLSFDELPHGAAVGELHDIAFEVVVGEAEVEILFGVVLHLLQLSVDDLTEVLVNVNVDCWSVRIKQVVVLKLAFLFLLE